MDPLTMAAMAVCTVVCTKALEKTGEKVGEAVWNKSAKFLKSLKKESPDTVTAIEKSAEQPLDYGQAVLEVEKAAKADDVVARTMKELVTAAKADLPPNIDEFLEEITKALKSRNSKDEFLEEIIKALKSRNSKKVENSQKLAEKIKAGKG